MLRDGIPHPEGLVAVVPTREAELFTIIVCAPQEEIMRLNTVAAPELDLILQRHLPESVDQSSGSLSIKTINDPTLFPITLAKRCEVARSSMFYIGQAATMLHPIGAQGFNLSVRDVTSLINILEAGGDDIAAQYAGARRADHWSTIMLTHSLATISRLPRMFYPLSGIATRAFGLINHPAAPHDEGAINYLLEKVFLR